MLIPVIGWYGILFPTILSYQVNILWHLYCVYHFDPPKLTFTATHGFAVPLCVPKDRFCSCTFHEEEEKLLNEIRMLNRGRRLNVKDTEAR